MTDPIKEEQLRIVREMVRLVVAVSDSVGKNSLLMNQSEHRRAIAVHIYARLCCRAHVPDMCLVKGTLPDALSDVLYTHLLRIVSGASEPGDALAIKIAERVVAETLALADARSKPTTGMSVIAAALAETEGHENSASLENERLRNTIQDLSELIEQIIHTVATAPMVSENTLRTWQLERDHIVFYGNKP